MIFLADELLKFTIIPEQQRFYNENSHWGVYVFSTDDEIPEYYMSDVRFEDNETPRKFSVIAGSMQQLTMGAKYEVEAVLEYNAKYKQYQYTPKMITSCTPKSYDEQVAYLKTQVTELQAKNILSVYPNVVADIIEGKEIDFTPINGIGEYTWNRIKNNVIENYAISDVLIMLQPLGVTYKTISKLISDSTSPTVLKQQLLDNPYILTRVKGMGFKRVDEIALKLNPDIKVSLKRVVAFIKYYLHSIANDSGNTWVALNVLDEGVSNTIPECLEIYQGFIEQQKNDGMFLYIEDNKVGLVKYREQELNIINILKYLDKIETDYELDIPKGIAEAEEQCGFKFTVEQIDTVNKVCDHNIGIFSGKSGCGKSTILRAITNIYKNSGKSIACCALSAKAAQRITETTGRTAMTIHRLLKWNGNEFKMNQDNRLDYDVIIVDETSMINTHIFYALVKAVKEGARIVMCGDDGQLPPIGEGNIFHDLLMYDDTFACCKLTKIMRQAEKSGIVTDAAKIRENISPLDRPELKVSTGELNDMTYMFRDNREGMRELAIKLYLKAIEQSGVDNTIIITPCKQNRTNSTFEINNIIQDELIPDTVQSIKFGIKEFRIGAKVIQRSNNYDLNVFNGEVGFITDIFKYDGKNMVRIDFGNGKIIDFEQSLLADVELAYALTCHLTQGSEYQNVICIIDNTHYKLLDSCLLYTAITRAKKKCLLIAEPSAFRRCIQNKASDRNTWLSYYKDNENKEEVV